MLRVCHIVSDDYWGGAETVVYNLLANLENRQDIELHVILFNRGELFKRIEGMRVARHVADEARVNMIGLLSKVRSFLSDIVPDVIHTHGYKENILGYMAASKKDRPAIMATQHGIPEIIYSENILNKLKCRVLFWILSRKFDLVVAVSNDLRNRLINSYGFHEDKVKVVHNGTVEIRQEAFAGRHDCFTVGSAGRLFPVKDYTFMVEVANRIMEMNRDVRFVLIGDGPERKEVEQRIALYGLEDMFILNGFQGDTDSFFRGIDIYMNTSKHEGMPVSVLEAMSYGLPVICPGIGGLAELVEDGKTGFLVPEKDPEIYAERCVELMDNDSLRELMSRGAAEKVSRSFSAEKTAAEYESIYCSLTGMCL